MIPNLSLIEKLEFWMYKKAPKLLTFFQQFTIMEWMVLLIVGFYIMESL